MTTLTLTKWNGWISFPLSILNGFKKVGKAVVYSMALARQTEANRRIAHFVKHEYPHATEAHIIHELNRKTIERLQKEFYGHEFK